MCVVSSARSAPCCADLVRSNDPHGVDGGFETAASVVVDAHHEGSPFMSHASSRRSAGRRPIVSHTSSAGGQPLRVLPRRSPGPSLARRRPYGNRLVAACRTVVETGHADERMMLSAATGGPVRRSRGRSRRRSPRGSVRLAERPGRLSVPSWRSPGPTARRCTAPSWRVPLRGRHHRPGGRLVLVNETAEIMTASAASSRSWD